MEGGHRSSHGRARSSSSRKKSRSGNTEFSSQEKDNLLYNYIQKRQFRLYSHMSLEQISKERLHNHHLGSLLADCYRELNRSRAKSYDSTHVPQTAVPEEMSPSPSQISQLLSTPITFTSPQLEAEKSLSPPEKDVLRPLLPPSPVTTPQGRYIPPAARTQPTPGAGVPPTPAQIRWVSQDNANVGHFFINKVYTDREKTSPWRPPHFVDTVTQIMTFEDLVPTAGLQMALISDDRPLPEIRDDNYFGHFPADVDLTLVCGLLEKSEHVKPYTERMKLEPHNHQEDADSQDHSVCDKCRSIRVTPVNIFSRDYMARLLLLRYEYHVRIVIPSASISHLCFESVCQFGWYCDLPISLSWADQVDLNETPFSRDLHKFLVGIGVDPTVYLEKVNFGELSHAVQLVSAIYGPSEDQSMGLLKVESLTQNMYWPPACKKQCVCQLTGLGSTRHITTLTARMFKLERGLENALNKDKLKIIYPSEASIQTWQRESGVRLSDATWWGLIKNRDKNFLTTPFLHNIDCPKEVLPKANVYQQFTVLEDDKNPDRSHHYGWLVAGSQTLGEGSWGARYSRGGTIFYRYELAVGIFPYEQHTDAGRVVYCFDLSQVGLQYHAPVPYTADDIPFTPATKENDRLFHLIGYVEMSQDRNTTVKRLPPKSPLYCGKPEGTTATPHFPIMCSTVATLHREVWSLAGLHRAPPQGSVVAFLGMRDQKSFRAGKITHCFDSEKAACEHFFKDQKDWQSVASSDLTETCYVGVLARTKLRFAFLEPLSQYHPFHRSVKVAMAATPPPQSLPRLVFEFPDHATAAFIHDDYLQVYQRSNPWPSNSWPRIGTVFTFEGVSQGYDKFKVTRIVKIFKSEEETLRHFGISLAPVQIVPTLKDERSIEARMAALGLKSEMDVIRYLNKPYENVQAELMKQATPSQQYIETQLSMNPTKISNDMDWLERHVTTAICDGDFPARTEGCHSVEAFSGFVETMRNKHLV